MYYCRALRLTAWCIECDGPTNERAATGSWVFHIPCSHKETRPRYGGLSMSCVVLAPVEVVGRQPGRAGQCHGLAYLAGALPDTTDCALLFSSRRKGGSETRGIDKAIT